MLIVTKWVPRRDTAANWTSNNPTLDAGEFGFETDTDKMKLGDGSTAWTSLGYWTTPTSVSWGAITGTLAAQTDLQTALNTKQATLIAGSNLKTINGISLLGSGNLTISGGGGGTWGSITGTLSAQTDLQAALDAKAPLASPTFTGTVSGITATMVGAPTGSGTSTGANTGDQTTIVGITGTKAEFNTAVSDGNIVYVGDSIPAANVATTAGHVVLSRASASGGALTETVLATSELAGRGSTGSIAAISLGTGLTMTGTVLSATGGVAWGGITGTLSSQTDLQTALNAKAPLASPTFTGTVSGITAAMVGAPSGSGTSSGTNTGDQTITLTGQATGSGTGSFAVTLDNASVIGKVLTGFTAGAGTVAATDTILQAVQKLDGNDALKAPLASPTFTGTVTLPAGQAVNGVTLTTGGTSTEYLSADGTYTTPAGGGAFNPVNTFKFYSDYIGLSTDGGLIAEQGGTGAAVTIGTIAGEPGAVFGTTGTSSTGRAGLLSSLTAIRLGTGEYVYEARVYVETLSTPTERYSYRVGFLDLNSSNTNQTDCVAFVYDEGGVMSGSTASADWQTVTASNSTRTWNTGLVSTTVTAGAYNRFTITVNAAGTSATFAVNGSTIATHTANIPTGSGREVGFGFTMQKSIGTGTACRVFHDYIAVTGNLTTPR